MKIQFICTGNICRSAMAHKLMEKKIKDNNIDAQIYSAGIYAYDGDIPTDEAIEVMEEYGVNLKSHRATNIRNSNIKEMDLILCATTGHKLQLQQMYPDIKEKIFTLNEYIGKEQEIKDPWGYGLQTYRICASQINEYLDELIKKIYNIKLK